MTTAAISMNSNPSIDFNVIYRSFAPMVKSLARQFKFCEAVADDIVQQVFFSAWQNIGSIRDEKALPGWIKTIARNACLKEVKKSSRYVEFTEINQQEMDDVGSLAENLSWKYSLEILEEVMRDLPKDKRNQVAAAFYLDRKPIKEIADEFGMKNNTVLSHLRRFRLAISKPFMELLDTRAVALV